MRLGCCAPPERASVAARSGFAYLEPRVGALAPQESDESFAPIGAALTQLPLTCEAFNVFLPADLSVVGPGVDWPALQGYVCRALTRAAGVGGRVVVFGSGASRRRPDDWDAERTREQLVAFCRLCADTAQGLGLTVVIEPLFTKATNTVNSVEEAVRLAREAGREEVAVLADLFHMAMEREPMQNLVAAAPLLRHVHVPVPDELAQNPEGPGFDHREFFRTLKRMGYDGRISVEENGGRFRDFGEEAPRVHQYLAELWESV